MFDRLSEESRRALYWARLLAHNSGSLAIEGEHIFVGVWIVFPQIGLPRDLIARHLGFDVPTETPMTLTPERPFGATAVGLLKKSTSVANQLGHHRIRPEHFMLAFLEESSRPVGQLLREAGIESDFLIASAARAARSDDAPMVP